MSQEIHTQVTPEELAHTFDEAPPEVDLKVYSFEDWVTLGLFWLMTGCVFLQFFTRYVLNNSYAWTEEIAVNCLIGVVFLGSVMCVRMSRHIQVDVLYHYVPPQVARVMSILVDVLRIVFFAYTSWLMWRYLEIVADEEMVTVALPRNIVFYTVLAAFVLMFFRSVQVFIDNMRRGYSVLERPEEFQSAGD
ncbi:TRAP transporter small permease [Agrobacterium radiobacter]|jgi:TRAP-type C4-dicarboxylate transport system permease small subunit|uniref:TRAP transporter small permease protein n=4 Tax=Agrobacterium tumefaciens complex TaxID=1183400 RepID=A0AAW8LWL7_AGRTU|nr:MULTISPECIES: TRAP transporter small permease [Agrobacterium tumefaciens complex]AYM83049.1 dicarboxylate ABC transporter ATPase [Agrobacterium tumefaciens]KAB0461168.1 TRAP transporter small permease [Agrobacterium tumefaciens]KWT77474.1 ABC transporter permease [Agrobacterium radiobacter]KWT84522.1 ABC transporter permease [Agrobacterium tumefaciens str. B6]MBP2540749.1 TRAP-type C4-dicarboxylate transport system permease small subunit [Agrobacterium tumefaciens]